MARPTFEVTQEKREAVITLVQAGASQEKISNAIGCAPKSLRKYFAPELQGIIFGGQKSSKKGKYNQRLALRQQVSITCPCCLTVIKLVELDPRQEAKIRRRDAARDGGDAGNGYQHPTRRQA